MTPSNSNAPTPLLNPREIENSHTETIANHLHQPASQPATQPNAACMHRFNATEKRKTTPTINAMSWMNYRDFVTQAMQVGIMHMYEAFLFHDVHVRIVRVS